MDYKALYYEHKRRTWKLRDPRDGDQVEEDIKDYWNTQVDLAARWFEQEFGYYPITSIPPPCLTDHREEPREELFHSQTDREIVFTLLHNLKTGKSYPYHLGGLGYVLSGVPWDKIPAWAQASIMKYKA
jgi:hypothetical protein